MTERPADTLLPASNPRNLAAIFDRNEVKDTYRISYLANSLVLPVYDDIKRDFGLNRGEYLLLFCLAHMPELTAQDVANMTGRPRNSISRAVHRMLSEGYLNRIPDAVDGRQAWLTITRKGRKLHETIVKGFEAREEQILGALDKKERQTLDRILQKLVLHTAGL
ncbi:MarR family winged helix-turn-helix transcriptional regulator [Pelagibius sp. Alg239-R121]|uniref:MarR family winged helix-turn-helix transcriptional regulator n=1 Tax=Pelagibius sp. Alg239-R121 TaxID=2993448 RepID=UPI0024A6460D|nr:MarR family transcriptional regulator [Pelagibius sp. Alg239-R121]